jgi:hypothetical protein
MNAPVTKGHSSWHRVRNGAITTYFPRYEASDVAAPVDEMSGTSGMGRSCTMPWLAGGGAGSPELPHAANSVETQSVAMEKTSDLGMP